MKNSSKSQQKLIPMSRFFQRIFVIFCLTSLFSCNLPEKYSQEEATIVNVANRTHKQFASEDLSPLVKTSKKKVKVALFLPLSGKHKELGEAVLNAASISLFENDNNANLELIPIDSKEGSGNTSKAFKEVINRDIKIVIGPIFSSSIREIENDLQEHQITAFSLSNNQILSEKLSPSGGAFITGITPESQIDVMVGYNMEQGRNNFAVIAPSNSFGFAINSSLRALIKRRDGFLINSDFYRNLDSKEMDRVAKSIINSFRIPEELLKRSKEDKERVISESDRIYPNVIIIPESGSALSRLASSLKKLNVEEREYLLFGTNQWDDVATYRDPNLFGAMFVAPENEKFRNFERSYYQIYAHLPPRVSSIAYDMVLAIANVVDAKDYEEEVTITPNDFISYESGNNGFEGIDGLFRFLPNGLVQRSFAVLEVGNGSFKTVEEASDKFLKY